MPRLIDAYKLKSCFTPALTGRTEYSADEILLTIATMPTVDAEPVVRCKDCRFYLQSNEICELVDTRLRFYETHKNWTGDCFCSWGERA